MNKMFFAIPLAVAAVFAFAQQEAAPDFGSMKGKKAVFSMVTSEGKTVTNETLKGKVVLIDFWATWCGPCKAASPSVQALHDKYGKDGLVVIGANAFERTDPGGAAAGYAKEHNYTYMMTIKNDALAKSWGIKGIPSFAVVGKDGTIVLAQVGFSAGKTNVVIEDAIKGALGTK
jgi:thiol-disulfide isomerase/thioredoxin